MNTTQKLFSAGLLAISINLALAPMSYANTSDWNPISSERLIKLPTNVMERAINHDFLQSPLANKLQAADTRLTVTQTDLAGLKQSISQSEGEDKIELRHQFLEQKSSYIDQMEQRQTLRRNELQTRLALYRGLMRDMKKDKRRAKDPVSADLVAQQHAARTRMESMANKVDESLFEMVSEEQSKYATEYGNNLQKIKELQMAIREHEMHRGMEDGIEGMTREAYIQNLMNNAEADMALLGQEDEMLGYMARLIAMDAQALQIEVTYGALDDEAYGEKVVAAKPANMVDFFIN